MTERTLGELAAAVEEFFGKDSKAAWFIQEAKEEWGDNEILDKRTVLSCLETAIEEQVIITEKMRRFLAERLMKWEVATSEEDDECKWWVLPDGSLMSIPDWKPDALPSHAVMVLMEMAHLGWGYRITGHDKRVECVFWLDRDPRIKGYGKGYFSEAIAWSAMGALENEENNK